MIEKVEIGLATLYNGDCAEVLSLLGNKTIDHTITDPPYEKEAHTANRRVLKDGKVSFEQLEFEALDAELRDLVATEIARLTSRWALVFCQIEGWHLWNDALIKAGLEVDYPMLWVKPDGKPRFFGIGPSPNFEAMATAYCGPGQSWNGGGRRGTFICNKYEHEKVEHQTVKPQKLMREIVELFTNKDETILDCFMGSGSTGVAATSLGRRFIGIERNPEYFEICCKRIEAAQENSLLGIHNVKTKAFLTSPLISFERERKPGAVTVAKALPKRMEFSAPPKITVTEAPKMESKTKFVDPFLAFHAATLEKAGTEHIYFDDNEWDWEDKSPVGLDVEIFRNFMCICFKRFSTGKRIGFEMSERCTLNAQMLRRVLNSARLITFNGWSYDLPMIFYALAGHSLEQIKMASDRVVYGGLRPWDVCRELGISLPKLDHVDLLEPNPSVRQGLKMLAARLHSRFITDLPFEPDAWLTRREMNVVTLYCMDDLDKTHILFDALKEPYELRRALSNEYKTDFRSKSDAQIGEAIVKIRVEQTGQKIARNDPKLDFTFQYAPPSWVTFEEERMVRLLGELKDATFEVIGGNVQTPKELENCIITIGDMDYAMGIGGLHSTEAHQAVLANEDYMLVDIDVSSQYPNIILKLGLYPEAIGPVFLPVYGAIVKERLEAKAAGNKVKAEGLKISVNGVYGKLGSAFSFLYAPQLMIATTLTGQLSLLMLIERCEMEGIVCVSGNTDGVVLRCPRKDAELLDKIIKKWEADTGFSTERTRYKALYSSSVNSYMAVKEDGKVKRKGPIANPWGDHDLRGQMSKNPQMSICSDAVMKLITDNVPIEETIMACKDPRAFLTVIRVTGGGEWRGNPLGRVARYYWSTQGEPITYVKSGKKVAKTDGAAPLMELTDALPNDIDYLRYINEAKDIAEDIRAVSDGGLLNV